MSQFKRIVIHWTGGSYTASEQNRGCYHFLVESDGKVVNGKYTPEDNLNCYDGKYAPHTGGGNTNAIGISMCGMFEFSFDWNRNEPKNVGKYPLTAVQCEATWKKIAQICKKYSISISPDTVMTHYEFGKKFPNTSSYGKPDIVHLPYQANLKPNQIGDFIRNKVKWYLNNI